MHTIIQSAVPEFVIFYECENEEGFQNYLESSSTKETIDILSSFIPQIILWK